MDTTKRPVNIHKAYHAHIYFDAETAEFAKELRDTIADKFGLKVGRFHETLVGPHLRWSFQVVFGDKDFNTFVPWLDHQRRDLSVLVHGLSGNNLKDHTDHAYWLGEEVRLNLNVFAAQPASAGPNE